MNYSPLRLYQSGFNYELKGSPEHNQIIASNSLINKPHKNYHQAFIEVPDNDYNDHHSPSWYKYTTKAHVPKT